MQSQANPHSNQQNKSLAAIQHSLINKLSANTGEATIDSQIIKGKSIKML